MYFDSTSNPQYSQLIALTRYARWLDDKNRRETWEESVSRYVSFFENRFAKNDKVSDKLMREIKDNILNLKVMPSMRALMTAGPALDKSNIAGYNCSYIAVDHPRVFDEAMFILMNGTGVGFSVERQYINKLPEVPEELHQSETIIKVHDSKKGWAKSYKELISLLYSGMIPKWDMSEVRPAGARLKTFGGRASGPAPLEELFIFTVATFEKAKGRRLTSIECHDMMCKIGDIVVVGGVRRSALISLSNLSDDRMRSAKSGTHWPPLRRLANNSVAYTEFPDFQSFFKEWFSLHESHTGERGIYNRVAAKKQAIKTGRRDSSYDFGTNPCGEIILRPNGFCNLTEVVIRHDDTLESLKEKVRIATILGTMQASLTDFPYLRPIWKKNAEEEALLGVSFTGIMDHNVMSGREGNEVLISWLDELKNHAIATNKKWASNLGINQSAAITCVKPSGTVSQLVDSASGIHDRFSSHYIRRIRGDKKDPLSQFMKDSGIPCEEDVHNPSNFVYSFPMKAPNGSMGKESRSAIAQLEHWKIYKEHWCEHNPSVTIYYNDDEFLGIGQWVWDNFDLICGVSFLPREDHVYKQAPYEAITEDKFKELAANMPVVNWEALESYEKEDSTTGTQELACTGGACELVNIGNSAN